MQNTDSRIKNISNLLGTASKNVQKAQRLLDSLTNDLKNSYDDIPGLLGTFDGEKMISEDGKEYEMNPNYVAKSLLVVGDSLKMVEEEGKPPLFKQVSKVPRKHMEGILNKKEGEWYALTDTGSYKVLEVAVEFRDAKVNDEVLVQVPEDNLNAPYAALEKLMKEDKKEVEKEEKKAPVKKRVVKEVIEKKKPKTKKEPSEDKSSKVGDKKAPAKKTVVKEKTKTFEGGSSDLPAQAGVDAKKKEEPELDDDDLR